jgi:hypothetical protein
LAVDRTKRLACILGAWVVVTIAPAIVLRLQPSELPLLFWGWGYTMLLMVGIVVRFLEYSGIRLMKKTDTRTVGWRIIAYGSMVWLLVTIVLLLLGIRIR